MEADDVRLQFDDRSAHLLSEGSKHKGRRGRHLDAKLGIIMGEALSPGIFACFISTGGSVAEEIEIYWFAGSSTNPADLIAHLRRWQQSTGKRTEPAGLRYGDRHVRPYRTRHRGLHDRIVDLQ